MYEISRAAQVSREMERYSLEILGLSEVRWNQSGKVTLATGHSVLYSGPPNENDIHRNGVGLMLTRKALDSLIEWEPINDRLLMARFFSKFQNVTIIQCYSPTNTASKEEKDQFYQQLQSAVDKAPRRYVIFVMGDMNAKVGRDYTGRESIMGKEGIGEMNENGELFADLCAQNDLVIGGTIFTHRRIHKTTWISPDQQTENQIDHIAISRRWRRTLSDVRAYRGADASTDHNLVIAKLQIRISAKRPTEETRCPRFDTNKLGTEEMRHDFTITLQNRFQILADMPAATIEDKWSRVKTAYTETCREKLGTRKRKFKSWLSENTIKIIDNKREIRQRLIQARTRAQKQNLQAEYKTINKEVKKSAKKDKRNYVDQLACQAQEAAHQGNLRTLYNITRLLSGKRNNINRPIKDKNGQILTKMEDQLNRWKEHFEDLPSKHA